jgi:hypothetical protein
MAQDRQQQNMIIMLVISIATEQLLDSQEELCSMKLVTSCVRITNINQSVETRVKMVREI